MKKEDDKTRNSLNGWLKKERSSPTPARLKKIQEISKKGAISKEIREKKMGQKTVSEIRKRFETNDIEEAGKEVVKEGKVRELMKKFQETKKEIVRDDRKKERVWKEMIKSKDFSRRDFGDDGGSSRHDFGEDGRSSRHDLGGVAGVILEKLGE